MRPLREEQLAPVRMTKFCPGALEFRGYAFRNPTARAAMRRVAKFAASQGRVLRWVVAS